MLNDHDLIRELLRADRVRSYHAPVFGELPLAADVETRFRAEEHGDPAPSDDGRPVLFGSFARFDQWNEINSMREGNFLERVDPHAFDETFAEYGPQGRGWIRAIFDHGHDPSVGMKPIGVPTVLEARGDGPYYEVDLFDSLDALVVDGLRSGAYGASYRFSVADGDEVVDFEPTPSSHNPRGLPEVTIMRATVKEFGPTALGADPYASAEIRSGQLDVPVSPTRPLGEPGTEGLEADKSSPQREAFLRFVTLERYTK